MFSFLELSEMVQCDKCNMEEETIMQRTPETGKKAEAPSQMTLIINVECMSCV